MTALMSNPESLPSKEKVPSRGGNWTRTSANLEATSSSALSQESEDFGSSCSKLDPKLRTQVSG